MTTVEILAVLGCGGLFVLLGWITRDRPANLLLRAGRRTAGGQGEADAERCGGCAHPCEIVEQDDA